MPKVQFQNGSLMTSIPTEVKVLFDLEKGDLINFNITDDGEVKVVKVCEKKQMQKKVKCIKTFLIEKCDDEGFTIENKYLTVEEGQIWSIDEDKNFIGGEVRLIRSTNKNHTWLEIPKEMFEENFIVVKEGEK